MEADPDENGGLGKTEGKGKKHKGKHDKDKPWDDPSIDHWKIEKFDPSWNDGGMLEVSSFSTLFPQYRGNACPPPPPLFVQRFYLFLFLFYAIVHFLIYLFPGCFLKPVVPLL